MRAIVLAGGRASRLRPLSDVRPKPLLPVANEPLLARLLRGLAAGGVREATLAVGADEASIRSVLGDALALPAGPLRLRYLSEGSPLGSGGATAAALALMDDVEPSQPLLVCNGDLLSDFDPRALLAFHRARVAQASLALARAPSRDRGRFGVVELAERGRVARFLEKPAPGETQSDWVNAGYWLLQSALLEGRARDRFWRLEDELFPQMAAASGPIFGFPLPAAGEERPLWLDLGTPPSYLAANRVALAREGRRIDPAAAVDPRAEIEGDVRLAAGVVVQAGARLLGPLALGRGCRVGTGATLRDSVLWERVAVGAGAVVTSSVLAEGVVVPAGAAWESRVEVAPSARRGG